MSIHLDEELCERSGCCVQICPEEVFDNEAGQTRIVKPSACTDCYICVENCCAGALSIE